MIDTGPSLKTPMGNVMPYHVHDYDGWMEDTTRFVISIAATSDDPLNQSLQNFQRKPTASL